MGEKQPWYVYILECSDGTYYTGITTDTKRRLKEHNNGTGARYTRSRMPVRLIYKTEVQNRSEASGLEYRIKKLPRNKKTLLIRNKLHLIQS